MKLTAELVAHSSVVGRSVMFKNEAGACAALVMVSVPNPQFDYGEIAEPVAHLIAAAPDTLAALIEIEAALRKDSRDKSIHRDTVEYHLDGQAMYSAINRARVAIAEATATAQVPA